MLDFETKELFGARRGIKLDARGENLLARAIGRRRRPPRLTGSPNELRRGQTTTRASYFHSRLPASTGGGDERRDGHVCLVASRVSRQRSLQTREVLPGARGRADPRAEVNVNLALRPPRPPGSSSFFLAKVAAAGFLAGACMETFMCKTGFYEARV